MTEQILRNAFKVKTVRKTIGYYNDTTGEVVVSGDPYDEGMKIQVKFYLGKYSPSLYFFSLGIKALSACCGVLEIIRPHSSLSEAQFTVAMDVIVEQLEIRANQPYNEWGNQLLATTSTESGSQWVKYVKSRKWDHFPPAINPRSGRGVTIWRKVV